MDQLLQDLKFAVRSLSARPGFTAIALLALAVGIGANSAIFSVVHAVLIRPLPFAEPDRLVMIWHDYTESNLPKASISVPSYLEYRDHMQAFEQVAAATPWSANLTGSGDPERVQGMLVTANFLRTLGVGPAAGRDFLPEEDRPGANRVVILGHGLWERRFASDRSIVGRTVALNGEEHTVVGVLPAGIAPLRPADLYKPIAFTDAQRAPSNHGNEFLLNVARLRAGATLERARAEMDALAARLREQYYDQGWRVSIVPLRDETVGDVRPALLILMTAVGCVLLITCANVANLLLARATARRREIALRAALGAGRWRLVRQLLTESVLLAVAGGALGLLLAVWGIRAIVAAAPDEAARALQAGSRLGVDPTVLLFTLLVSVLTGLLFGTAPAARLSRTDLNETLKEGSRGQGIGARGHRLLGGLVVVQVALALVLLVGAGLLVRSFTRLRRVDPGFRAENLLTFQVTLPTGRYDSDLQVRGFFDALLPRLRSLPGVRQAAAVSNLPMSGDNAGASFAIEGVREEPHQPGPHGDSHVVTDGYFATLGIPVLRGRGFDGQDGPDSTPAAVVDQVLADRYWPGQDPLGHRLAFAFEGSPEKPIWRTIVGVVGHVKKYGLDGRVKEQYYTPAGQRPRRSMVLALRTAGDPRAMIAAVRAAVRGLDPDLPLFRVAPMEQVVDDTLKTRRFVLLLLGLFASVALTLAAVGLYGVLAYAVGQRRHEIGVRMALGAEARSVVRMVVGQGMTLCAAGLLLGALGAVAATRFLSSLLFSVSATDPGTFAAVPLGLALVALLACWIPARRAARVDPAVALRYE